MSGPDNRLHGSKGCRNHGPLVLLAPTGVSMSEGAAAAEGCRVRSVHRVLQRKQTGSNKKKQSNTFSILD